MAARQDQTLVIVNIICILLFLLCAVFAYIGLKGRSDAKQELAGVRTQLSGAEQRARTFQDESANLRENIGFSTDDNPSDIETTFQAEMALYATGQQPSVSYRAALKEVDTLLQSREASEAAAKAEVIGLTARLTAVETEADLRIQEAEKARSAAQAAAEAQLSQFNLDREQLEATKKELLASLDKQKASYEGTIAQLDAQIRHYEGEVDKLKRTVENLQDRLKPAEGTFEVADGNITWVQGDMVWINLGSADALRELVTFSVFDADEHDTARSAQKGSIEVTRVLNDFQAEARITSDDPLNPILKGDRIYSPAWQRGKQLRFGLAGIIDVDGDGRSDLQLVRDLIALNGGGVDAYVSDDGKVEGTMSVNTRYLIVGKVPEGVLWTQHLDGWQAMNKDAVSLGVQIVTLDQFLDQMGYESDSRTVQLGAGASARDFPPQQYGESAASGTSGMPQRFRPRAAENLPVPRSR